MKLEPIPDYGDLMDLKTWNTYRGAGAIVPSDGCGNWATAEGFSEDHDCFKEKPEWATHVMWFNR